MRRANCSPHADQLSFRQALERWTPKEVDDGWYDLAEELERRSIALMDAVMPPLFPDKKPPGPVQ